MRLTDEQIVKFQTLYEEQFGRSISTEEAREKGIKLVRLMALVYKPASTNNKTR